jgi:hypothetical protein
MVAKAAQPSQLGEHSLSDAKEKYLVTDDYTVC